MKLNGAAILIECLIEQNVGTVFGFPGGAVLPIYDELYKRQDRIQHVLTAHEQHAGHAADGYARASGKTGVCIATSGPGATNLVTPIATAYMDSSPVVFITGNVPQSLMGTDSFHHSGVALYQAQLSGYARRKARGYHSRSVLHHQERTPRPGAD